MFAIAFLWLSGFHRKIIEILHNPFKSKKPFVIICTSVVLTTAFIFSVGVLVHYLGKDIVLVIWGFLIICVLRCGYYIFTGK